MKYLRLTTTDPYYNLAVEEFLFRHTKEDVFMLWQNASTVVIGKNQNAYAEIDLPRAAKSGIRISRRITGGGAVYHDLGNLNFSFITSEENAKSLDYAHFCQPILGALATLGLRGSLNGRNDLEIDGRKFSGNAQYTADGRILHHGTILFDTDLSVMSSVLRVDKEKLAYKAVKSSRGRVVNLSEHLGPSVDLEALIAHIKDHVLQTMHAEPMEPPMDKRIDALTARNASQEWIYSDKRYLTRYTVARKKKYPFGLVQLELELEKDRIESVRISGDFFGIAPIEELEKLLVGQSIEAIPPMDLSPYINGMTSSDFSELLKG